MLKLTLIFYFLAVVLITGCSELEPGLTESPLNVPSETATNLGPTTELGGGGERTALEPRLLRRSGTSTRPIRSGLMRLTPDNAFVLEER